MLLNSRQYDQNRKNSALLNELWNNLVGSVFRVYNQVFSNKFYFIQYVNIYEWALDDIYVLCMC